MDEIINAPACEGFHMLKIDMNYGLTNPVNHLQRFVTSVRLEQTSNMIIFRAFSSTLMKTDVS